MAQALDTGRAKKVYNWASVFCLVAMIHSPQKSKVSWEKHIYQLGLLLHTVFKYIIYEVKI